MLVIDDALLLDVLAVVADPDLQQAADVHLRGRKNLSRESVETLNVCPSEIDRSLQTRRKFPSSRFPSSVRIDSG